MVPRGQSGATALTELRFGYGDLDFKRIHVGDKLWKTNDPELDKRIRQTFAGEAPRFQRPIALAVHGAAGHPLTLIARDELGHVVQVDSLMPLARAEKTPLSGEKLREQLGRLGGTPFKLGDMQNGLAADVVLPVSELTRRRREVVASLEALRAKPRRWQLISGADAVATLTKNPGRTQETGSQAGAPAELIVLVRDLTQLEAALKCGVGTVYCEFEDPKKYREAVTLYHTARGCAAGRPDRTAPAAGIFVAPPRIFKMGEDWVLNLVKSANADGYLVRNHDHLKFFAGCRCVGDFSLNVANRISADYFKNGFNLERVTASYDLNASQLEGLLKSAPPEWFEITLHQHMPMFHMEHCVFCAFLSKGRDYHDCGRPCDRHQLKLRDRVGAEHPLKADAGCRNTLFNSQAQTGAEWVAAFLNLGVRNFRLEFLNETPQDVERPIARYRQLLRGEITGTQLWRELKLFNQLGVTRGQMAR